MNTENAACFGQETDKVAANECVEKSKVLGAPRMVRRSSLLLIQV